MTPVGYGASKANVKPPLPRVPCRSRFSRRDSLKRLRDKFSGPMAPRRSGSIGIDPLSHVGYTELKITSDSESEFPFSDDDDATSASHGNNDFMAESSIQRISQKLPKAIANNSSPVSQNHQTPESLPSLLNQPVQLESNETNYVSYMEPGAFVKHGLEELNWTQPKPNHRTSTLPELIALDDVPQSADNYKPIAAFPQPSNLSILSDVLSLDSVLSPSNVLKISEKSAEVTGSTASGNISPAKHTIGAGFSDGSNPAMSNNMNSFNIPASSRQEQTVSEVLGEPLRTNDSGRVEEAVKSPSKISSSDMDLSPKAESPRVHADPPAVQKSDALGASALDMVQMEAALERLDSDHESLNGISIKEIEGETVLDRLKQQVEYDRRCMKALFKELEEERNAAAIAANQAMAMITRLQEEKAALHMESLQYLRMMEEQAEYDMEALEKANDLLAEREKEIQDLEAELEIYRNNMLDESVVDYPRKETRNAEVESETVDKCHLPRVENGPSASDDPKATSALKGGYKPEYLSNPELDFEDEKLYISRSLEKLEQKFHQISSSRVLINLANGEHAEHLGKNVDDEEDIPNDTRTQINHQEGENMVSLPKDLCAPNGVHGKDMSAELIQENHILYEENEYLDVGQGKLYRNGVVSKLETFENEIIDLKDRLEALDTDRDILKHALNSLQNGNDGLQFIQEIAHQLQELRKIEFKKR